MNLMFDMVDEAMCKPSTINQLKKNQKGKYGFVHVSRSHPSFSLEYFGG